MRRKKQFIKILSFVIVIILISKNFNIYLNKSHAEQVPIKNEKFFVQYFANKSSEDYYSKMENLFDNDPDSGQFNIYLKFKRNRKPKINLGPVGKRKSKNFYLIVEYTRIFGAKKFCERKLSDEQMSTILNLDLKSKLKAEKVSKDQYNLLDRCRYKNCFFSCDKDLAKMSDALLFHDADLRRQVNSIPEKKDYQKVHSQLFNFSRDPSQVWLLWNDEANYLQSTIDDFRFNWTLSFFSMSDISFCTYGCLTKSSIAMSESAFEDLVKSEFEKRKNTALWMVSNCNAKARINFVEKLALNHHIEIHGKCVDHLRKTYKNISLIEFKDGKCPRDSECEKETLERNKFFFAFENQNCSDYITEKFWRSLDFNLIPIVLHPNKEYYEKIAPVNSFIHLADFDYDPRKLSDYLNLVAEDRGLYSKYFEWKKFFKVTYKPDHVEQLRICELCEKLNNLNNNQFSYYDKISHFFNSQCTR